MKIYTIINNGKLWQAIDDMNSDEKWGEGYFFFKTRNHALKCLKDHRQNDKYNEYENAKIISIHVDL